MAQKKVFEFDSIGSRFWLESLDKSVFDENTKQDVLNYCTAYDDLYSRFKPQSLVSQLAKRGYIDNPPAELCQMLDYAKEIYNVTEGAFNITVGATLQNLGYGSSEYAGEFTQNPWRSITWNSKRIQAEPAMVLDFGGFGKGWMIDAITKLLIARGFSQFIVNGGGDMYVKSEKPVQITIDDPLRPGYASGSVWLQNKSLACSDIIKRSWQTPSGNKHHIVDTTTQDSSNTGVVASYVIADTALVADTMATVLIIKPDLEQRLKQRYSLQTRLLTS